MQTDEKITIKPENSKGERDVFLYIPDAEYKRHRHIGYIKNRTFFTSRWKSNQTFKKLSAIGINYKLLNEGGKYFDFIVVFNENVLLQTSREYFLKYSYFLHFKKNGLERQKFLRISDFGMDKANQYEGEMVMQLNRQMQNFGNILKNKASEMQEGLF